MIFIVDTIFQWCPCCGTPGNGIVIPWLIFTPAIPLPVTAAPGTYTWTATPSPKPPAPARPCVLERKPNTKGIMNKREMFLRHERVYYWLSREGVAPSWERVQRVLQFLETNQIDLDAIEAKTSRNFTPTRVWPCRVGNEQKYMAVVNGERIWRPREYFQALGIGYKTQNFYYFIRMKGTITDGRSR